VELLGGFIRSVGSTVSWKEGPDIFTITTVKMIPRTILNAIDAIGAQLIDVFVDASIGVRTCCEFKANHCSAIEFAFSILLYNSFSVLVFSQIRSLSLFKICFIVSSIQESFKKASNAFPRSLGCQMRFAIMRPFT
jgi:hypothetical protein